MSKPEIGRWYRDKNTGSKFKVLELFKSTLRVTDEFGNVRSINRLLWVTDNESGTLVKLKEKKP